MPPHREDGAFELETGEEQSMDSESARGAIARLVLTLEGMEGVDKVEAAATRLLQTLEDTRRQAWQEGYAKGWQEGHRTGYEEAQQEIGKRPRT
jgi:flagellar biosynthesis/type III secretory pathway protein FliH